MTLSRSRKCYLAKVSFAIIERMRAAVKTYNLINIFYEDADATPEVMKAYQEYDEDLINFSKAKLEAALIT